MSIIRTKLIGVVGGLPSASGRQTYI